MKPTAMAAVARRLALPFLFLAIAMLGPAAANAQTGLSAVDPGPRRIDISGSVGVFAPTEWGDLVILGTVPVGGGISQQVLAREITLDPAEIFDATITYWEGRYGFRTHASFAQSCVAFGRACSSAADTRLQSSSADVNIWAADVGGAIGMRRYRSGLLVWPYAFFGLGVVSYDFEEPLTPPLDVTSTGTPDPNAPVVIVSHQRPDQSLIVLEELNRETAFAVTLGVGTDFRAPLGPVSLGLRLEASDQIHRSPIDVRVAQISGFGRDVQLAFGLVHNLRAAAGLVVHFGR